MTVMGHCYLYGYDRYRPLLPLLLFVAFLLLWLWSSWTIVTPSSVCGYDRYGPLLPLFFLWL